jgi:hypothetical protein
MIGKMRKYGACRTLRIELLIENPEENRLPTNYDG